MHKEKLTSDDLLSANTDKCRLDDRKNGVKEVLSEAKDPCGKCTRIKI